MNLEETVAQTYADFTYREDKGEHYKFGPLYGPFTGDCEDFALTVIKRYYGSEKAAWMAFKRRAAAIIKCRATAGGAQIGHAIGRIDGRLFDNNSDKVFSRIQEMPYIVPGSEEEYTYGGLKFKFWERNIRRALAIVALAAIIYIVWASGG